MAHAPGPSQPDAVAKPFFMSHPTMTTKPFLVLVAAVSLALGALPICTLLAHDGAKGHEHEHEHEHEHGAASKLFTTRANGRALPLPKQDGVFHFVVYGDRTGGVPAGLKVLEQAVADTNLLDPDLVMTVGDLIQGYNEKPEWLEQMREYRAIMDRLRMRWYPVAGNHDVYWRGQGPAPEGQHESNYEEHFGPLWYSFQHKNAGFIVLYSDEGDQASNEKGFQEGRLQKMSPAQMAFLQESLDHHKDLDHVFLFLHHPRWIGGGYTGGNWDEVHQMLKKAGNVSAVFAGHIHQMRFDGPKDGIAYYTLATTGGALHAEIPGAGYLHHLNVVTVRPDSVIVAAIPVGAVIDPKEFTADFLADVNRARAVRPEEISSNILLQVDGAAAGEASFVIKNTATQPVDATVAFNANSRDWTTSLDHDHFTLLPGESKPLTIQLHRKPNPQDKLTLPRLEVAVDYVGKSSRISLPPTSVPITLRFAAVPENYFRDAVNHCLNVTNETAAVQVDSSELSLPDGPFTLEAWVRPRQTAGHRGLIAKTESSEFAFFMDEGVPQFDVHLDGRYVSAKADQILPVDQWSHLAGVFNGTQVQLYVNGQRIQSVPGQGKRTLNQLPLYIGADPDRSGSPSRSFLGMIDEVRISTGAVYQETFTPKRRLEPESSALLLMHFDRQIGPFLLDHSPKATKGMMGTDATLVPVD